MDLKVAFDFLQFWIDKKAGAWYSIPELEAIVDMAQLAYYSDIKPKYATSQIVKDALSPFRDVYNFTTSDTAGGNITVPENRGYIDLLDIQVTYIDNGRTIYVPVKLVNEDERANRLNSQIYPVTTTSPIAEQIAPRQFKLYPSAGYNGSLTFLRRPAAPKYVYTTISERVIVYDKNASTQLEWRDTEVVPILLKALLSIGINLSDSEVAQFAELKTQSNFQNTNRL